MRTKEKIKDVLQKLIEQIDSDYDVDTIGKAIDVMLDDLRDSDFFGTEGQCDPRGDNRNG